MESENEGKLKEKSSKLFHSRKSSIPMAYTIRHLSSGTESLPPVLCEILRIHLYRMDRKWSIF